MMDGSAHYSSVARNKSHKEFQANALERTRSILYERSARGLSSSGSLEALALPFRWPSGSGIRVGIYWKKEAESADVAISLPTASVRNEPSQNTLVPRGNQKEEKEKNLAGQTREKEDEDHDDDDDDDNDGDGNGDGDEDDAALLSLFARV
ncbi:hypothetical protein K0M31_012383 [Melipona bicolor]|uniref:Uncharacterized protein n=1 Tax=Melipona bicolor TaxID=60889 RepID=A0AA40FKC1_9HYME|nr:hypothetical protein K0M31_012383 [Melipona bicolor]